jgi:hypothetical protein
MTTTQMNKVLMAGAAAAVLFAAAARADTETSGALKSDVSRSATTTMPAYTVDELKSDKTHTLFMGADIAINLDRDLYRVRDVFGSNWVIEVNGRQREISAREAPVNLKITPNLKLTEVSATVVGFKKVPAYSYDNDPNVLLTRGLSKSAEVSNDLLAVSQNAQHRIDTMTNKADAGAAVFAGADDQFSAAAMMSTAEHAYSNLNTRGIAPGRGLPLASGAVGGGGDSMGLGAASADPSVRSAEASAIGALHQAENAGEPNGRIATRGFDAMDVEFDIRSAKPLHNPYVVTMTKFRASGAKPGMVQNLVYAESLHPIDEHLSHVHFTETGFPFNYELVDFQLHIYNQGEEVATNIAANRVELTRDEAFEYVKSEYIGAHPKDTLPAVPAMGRLPSDLPGLLARGKYAEAFYVKVNKDGLAYEAYSDPACTRRIDDDYLDTVVRKVRFKPALNNGRPVDGVASIKLAQLAI